jgi:hypothetical protein
MAVVLAGSGCASDDDNGNTGDDDGQCSQPLDEEVLDTLTTGFDQHFDMKPGTSKKFDLGTTECCYSFNPVDACVTWSVSPATGATIDADGNLTVDASATDGDVFTVTADVENGRKIVTSQVYIFTPEGNPFVGAWEEQSQLACSDGAEVTPESKIYELWFRADHRVNVTWMPFELYVDYWGTYTYDLETGALSIAVENGNYVPADIDNSGTFTIDTEGALELHDMWLGSPQESAAPAECGHVFTR